MLNLSVEYGSHLPALIKVITKTRGSVLELGMGMFSTPYLHFACYPNRTLISYTNQKDIYDLLLHFKSEYHEIHFVTNWDQIDISGHWSVALVDHEPAGRRKEEIKRLANSADYIVVHDTNPRLEKKYRYSEIYPFFKFRKDFNREKPYTAILSNFDDLSTFEAKRMENKSVAIFIPTYKRAHKLIKVYENAKNSSPQVTNVYFIIEKDDKESIDVIKKNQLPYFINERSRNYAGAINTAYLKTKEKYFFCGADDLDFKPGWLEICLKKMIDPIKVVGTNDLHHHRFKRKHEIGATHYLVLSENYFHNYTDCEFIETARLRGLFAPCLEAIVAHLHFSLHLSPKDETYAKQDDTIRGDKILFLERRQSFTQKIEAEQKA